VYIGRAHLEVKGWIEAPRDGPVLEQGCDGPIRERFRLTAKRFKFDLAPTDEKGGERR
jgi:hypothetical protein